ncbi:putative helicase [Venturia inaequalis]|nr:putative helicase [Venturia inaequalis]
MLIGKIIFIVFGYLTADKLMRRHEARKSRKRTARGLHQQITSPAPQQVYQDVPIPQSEAGYQRAPVSRYATQPRVEYYGDAMDGGIVADGEVVYETREIPGLPVSGYPTRPGIQGDLGARRGSRDRVYYEDYDYEIRKVPG